MVMLLLGGRVCCDWSKGHQGPELDFELLALELHDKDFSGGL